MYSFNELKKACSQIIETKETKLAILSNVSTQFFAKSIEGLGKLEGINLSVYDADYNQIDGLLLDDTSEIYIFKPNFVLLYIDTMKLYEEYLSIKIENRKDFADDIIERIKKYWELIEKKLNAKVLQINFTEVDDKVLGQYSLKVDNTFIYQIRKLNYFLDDAMKENLNTYPIDLLSVQIDLGREKYFDAALYYTSKMAISINALPYASKPIIDVLKSFNGNIKKCLVVDLDNTLWGGIIGDDGLTNIKIGHTGQGHAFTNLQLYIKELKENGIIIAVCSKNDEEIAKEPFVELEEMVLKLSDISVFVANWDDKVSNIKLIKETLNIGMDSIVFLDDNPFERNLVRKMIPEIVVPELPNDVAEWVPFLHRENYFNTISYSGEKSDRTKLYQEEYERKKLEKNYESIDEYLKSLEMESTVSPFDELHYSRISELTERSNQFNLRTVRYAVNDIKNIAESDKYITRYYMLNDKIGNHGLIAVAILKKENDKTLFIEELLMSCRVLKRGMEEFIINDIVDVAKAKGFETIIGEYIKTKKNNMVSNFYERMGFEIIEENKFKLSVDTFNKLKTFIKYK